MTNPRVLVQTPQLLLYLWCCCYSLFQQLLLRCSFTEGELVPLEKGIQRVVFSVKREKGKIERFILRLKFPLTVYFFTSLFLSLLTLHFRHCCSPAICRTLITYEANCDSPYVPLSSFYRRGRASERKYGVHFLEGDLVNSYNLCCRVSFSNKSQMTSKCGKNEKVAFEAQPSVSLMFFHILTSSVIYS